jgi:hypothetical protein
MDQRQPQGKGQGKNLSMVRHCCTILDKGQVRSELTLYGDPESAKQQCSDEYKKINPPLPFPYEVGDAMEFKPNTNC